MLKIRVMGDAEATWDAESELWISDDEATQTMLRAFYTFGIEEDISPRDRYLEKGISGKVWEAVKKEFGSLVELIELVPEEPPEEKAGVDY